VGQQQAPKLLTRKFGDFVAQGDFLVAENFFGFLDRQFKPRLYSGIYRPRSPAFIQPRNTSRFPQIKRKPPSLRVTPAVAVMPSPFPILFIQFILSKKFPCSVVHPPLELATKEHKDHKEDMEADDALCSLRSFAVTSSPATPFRAGLNALRSRRRIGCPHTHTVSTKAARPVVTCRTPSRKACLPAVVMVFLSAAVSRLGVRCSTQHRMRSTAFRPTDDGQLTMDDSPRSYSPFHTRQRVLVLLNT
jgi:hypothetical protein